METQKITVRLPVQLIHAVDTFINMGEFASRSEAIRRALKTLIEEMIGDINKKQEIWRKLQELTVLTDEVEKLRKK